MAGKRYLLDTNCLIWFQENNPKIPKSVMAEIQNVQNAILFSQVSLFEIAIKLKIGKLPDFKVTVENVYLQALGDGFTFVGIQNEHIYNYQNIPLFEDHRDPFDRLLIAAAQKENAIILSPDAKLNLYNKTIKVIW